MSVAPVPFPAEGLSDGVVTLRLKQDTDIEPIVEATRDPLIPRYTRVPQPNTAKHVRERLQVSAGERERGEGIHLLITDAADDALLGAVSLHGIDYENRLAEIGYWVASSARGRGVATRAVKLISRHGFDVLPIERIGIGADPENEASCRVAERAGFTREGILRSWICIKGRQSDAVSFSLLRSEVTAR